MSGPTFAQILCFRGGPLRSAAQAWARLAERVQERGEAVLPAERAATQAWEGPAAQAATHRLRRTRTAVNAAVSPLWSHREALYDLAEAGERLRHHARELTARAATAGIHIAPDGGVTVLGAPAGCSPPGCSPQEISAVRQEVGELLTEAARVDAEAVRRLRRLAPWVAGQALTHVPRSAVPERGTDPEEVHRWWRGLDPARQRYLLTRLPGLLGGLDGVPVAARDRANRAVLRQTERRLQARLSEMETPHRDPTGTPRRLRGDSALERERERLTEKREALERVAGAVSPQGRGEQPAYLVRLDTEGDGRLVLAYGNPDRADSVLSYVPGTGSALTSLGGDLTRTRRMSGDMAEAAPQQRRSTVYWLGYDAPDNVVQAVGRGRAEDATDDLRRFADGLHATHADGDPRSTFLGHSYGSTVVGMTARDGLAADGLIFVGSPGVGVGSADGLRIETDPSDNVWSTRALSDPIHLAAPPGLLGTLTVPDGQRLTAPFTRPLVHGIDPTREEFGGRTFPADALGLHSGYWDAGNPARTHMARIAVGPP